MKVNFSRLVRNEVFILTAIFTAGLLFTLFLGRSRLSEVSGGTWIPIGDAGGYDEVAKNFFSGRGLALSVGHFTYRSLYLPFYPLFLSFIYAIFGHQYLAVMLVQLVLRAFIPIFAYLIAKNLFQKKVAIISGIIAAFYMPFTVYTFDLMREVLFIFLFAASIYALTRAVKKTQFAAIAVAGILQGLAALTRGFGYGLPFISIAWIFIVTHKKSMRTFALATVLLCCFCGTISPWILRNYYVHGDFLLGEVSGSRQLWTGANPKYHGIYYSASAWRELLWRNPQAAEIETEKASWSEAIEFIKKDPLHYLDMVKGRINRLWTLPDARKVFNNLTLTKQNASEVLTLIIVYISLIGMLHSLSNWKYSSLLILILLFDLTFHGVFGATERYRLPIEWCLIIFSAYTTYNLINFRSLEWRNPEKVFIYEKTHPVKVNFPAAKLNKYGKLLVCFFLIILFIIYFSKLYYAYFLKPPKFYNKLSIEQTEDALKNRGLFRLWEKQDEVLTFKKLSLALTGRNKDILSDRPEEALGKYNSYIVIWEGEVNRIPKRGRLTQFDFTVNPGLHNLGEGTVFCTVAGNVDHLTGDNFRDRQRVVIFAKIKGLNVLGIPELEVYDIIPLQERITKI